MSKKILLNIAGLMVALWPQISLAGCLVVPDRSREILLSIFPLGLIQSFFIIALILIFKIQCLEKNLLLGRIKIQTSKKIQEFFALSLGILFANYLFVFLLYFAAAVKDNLFGAEFHYDWLNGIIIQIIRSVFIISSDFYFLSDFRETILVICLFILICVYPLLQILLLRKVLQFQLKDSIIFGIITWIIYLCSLPLISLILEFLKPGY